MEQENRYIVIVDDDEDDRLFLKEAFIENGSPDQFVFFENGVKLLDFLVKEMKNPPLLIIIDLHMPLKNGKETLLEIKSNVRFRSIPVLILSTGITPQTKKEVLDLGANCIVIKPNNFQDIKDLAKNISTVWNFN